MTASVTQYYKAITHRMTTDAENLRDERLGEIIAGYLAGRPVEVKTPLGWVKLSGHASFTEAPEAYRFATEATAPIQVAPIPDGPFWVRHIKDLDVVRLVVGFDFGTGYALGDFFLAPCEALPTRIYGQVMERDYQWSSDRRTWFAFKSAKK